MLHRIIVGLLALVLLGACRESTPDTPVHTAETHQRAPDAAGGPRVPAVGQRPQARLRSVVRSGTTDHDVASLLLECLRGGQQLAAEELATGRDPGLRALADTLQREWQRESLLLGQLAGRTHDQPSEEYTRRYQEFNRDVQAALDSAARNPSQVSGGPDPEFAANLAAHLRTGLRLVEEGIAHGSDPLLIALAHRLHHDQLRHLRQVQAWSSTHLPSSKP